MTLRLRIVQCLINAAEAGQVESPQNHMSGSPTTQPNARLSLMREYSTPDNGGLWIISDFFLRSQSLSHSSHCSSFGPQPMP
jgi:hypothetical protein